MDGGAAGSNQINMQELTAFINSNKKKSKSKKKATGLGKKGAPAMEEDVYGEIDPTAAGANRRGMSSTKGSKAKNKQGKTISAQAQETAYQMPKGGAEGTKTSEGGTAKFGASGTAAREMDRSGQVAGKHVTDGTYKDETFEGKAHALLDTDHETHSEPGNNGIVGVTPAQVP